jgi:hypothetical protein
MEGENFEIEGEGDGRRQSLRFSPFPSDADLREYAGGPFS